MINPFFDAVKCEVDKATGYLGVDRPSSRGEVIHILEQKCLPGAGEVTSFSPFRRVLRLWRNG